MKKKNMTRYCYEKRSKTLIQLSKWGNIFYCNIYSLNDFTEQLLFVLKEKKIVVFSHLKFTKVEIFKTKNFIKKKSTTLEG